MSTSAVGSRQSVGEAKASLREFAIQADQSAWTALLPLSKYVAFAGAGVAVASVVFGKTKLVGDIVRAGVRLLPTILKFL